MTTLTMVAFSFETRREAKRFAAMARRRGLPAVQRGLDVLFESKATPATWEQVIRLHFPEGVTISANYAATR